jgi:hypothetical protein
MDYLIVNSLGMVLDIAGAALLFWFGLPNRRALEAVLFSGADVLGYRNKASEREAWALVSRHEFWGRVGLCLLMGGSILQLLSNAMQRHLSWW